MDVSAWSLALDLLGRSVMIEQVGHTYINCIILCRSWALLCPLFLSRLGASFVSLDCIVQWLTLGWLLLQDLLNQFDLVSHWLWVGQLELRLGIIERHFLLDSEFSFEVGP